MQDCGARQVLGRICSHDVLHLHVVGVGCVGVRVQNPEGLALLHGNQVDEPLSERGGCELSTLPYVRWRAQETGKREEALDSEEVHAELDPPLKVRRRAKQSEADMAMDSEILASSPCPGSGHAQQDALVHDLAQADLPRLRRTAPPLEAPRPSKLLRVSYQAADEAGSTGGNLQQSLDTSPSNHAARALPSSGVEQAWKRARLEPLVAPAVPPEKSDADAGTTEPAVQHRCPTDVAAPVRHSLLLASMQAHPRKCEIAADGAVEQLPVEVAAAKVVGLSAVRGAAHPFEAFESGLASLPDPSCRVSFERSA
eukprot:CAMPEP_0170617392 /NCGR_PEP_ID=MMETSP0224-20130122/26397_1 /TAXON_ID=285029 /ORGANISM="Togula jolla, Strain CCCM 725" /LENGTH=311 /DNA_ID=CAMNT_0010943289 /DNA_START=53 /DNA_END=985 /DNA_ORIENTATION=-